MTGVFWGISAAPPESRPRGCSLVLVARREARLGFVRRSPTYGRLPPYAAGTRSACAAPLLT
ncbi:MAG: hypothetical protein ACRYG2_11360, partial [Janthinobacterium lividum]